MGDGKAQSRSASVGSVGARTRLIYAVKALKDAVLRVCRNPCSAIRDGDHIGLRFLLQLQPDLACFRRMLNCIVYEI